jgi:hypothetical protein
VRCYVPPPGIPALAHRCSIRRNVNIVILCLQTKVEFSAVLLPNKYLTLLICLDFISPCHSRSGCRPSDGEFSPECSKLQWRTSRESSFVLEYTRSLLKAARFTGEWSGSSYFHSLTFIGNCDSINRSSAKFLERICYTMSATALEAALQVGLGVVNYSWLCSACVSDRSSFVSGRTYKIDMAG